MLTAPSKLPISKVTWEALIARNKASSWAVAGVFATGVGPKYQLGSGMLYVGKSAGPLGNLVGSGHDQTESGLASAHWMVSRANKSAFWQFIDRIDPTRTTIAWSNICKMDVVGGQRPPNGREWRQIADASMEALTEEINFLRPRVTVFATSGLYTEDVRPAVIGLGFKDIQMPFEDGWTSLMENNSGQSIVFTKHPQGWPSVERDRVIELARQRLQ